MRVLRREKVWIHTHFLTDCVYLPDHHAREVREKMRRLLDTEGIVFGIHFDSRSRDEGLRIVLECIPFPDKLDRIQAALAEIIEPMPSRPRKTEVKIEPPAKPRIPTRRSRVH